MSAPELSLADHVCLALVGEGRTHGWAIVKLLAADGDVGRVWTLSRPLTYRSIDRLGELGLVDRADAGRRTELSITRAGRRSLHHWFARPVDHLRDLRTEFLVKLTLRSRAGLGAASLVRAQIAHLEPTIQSLLAVPPDDPIGLWRHESARAARRFLDRVGDIAG